MIVIQTFLSNCFSTHIFADCFCIFVFFLIILRLCLSFSLEHCGDFIQYQSLYSLRNFHSVSRKAMNISDGDNFILDFCIFQSIKSDRGMKNERSKEKQNYSNLKSTNLCRMYFFFFF
ncbi:hypothetical protein SSS_07152 [Sarcoptes scabiei]|nr:hypothetical protein SSS_07152 [Sarcoptes scabiei]